MDSGKKEFIDNVMRLNNQNRKVALEKESFFIIVSVVDDSKTEPTVTFTSITKTMAFTKVFTYTSFAQYKESIGFDGCWKAFISTMYNAINHKEGGEIKLELKKQKLTMTMIHPLANDLKVSSHIVFDNCYGNEEKEYNAVLFESMLGLYSNKLEIVRENEREKEQAAPLKDSEHKSLISISANSIKDVRRGALDVKKNVKRKYQSNLVNPNIKKRKKKGVEFIKDEDDEENEKA